ncbi:calcium-binding protein [Nostoc sp. PA-18-2419]|uniref:calcium-binding protein n=1 Tax=Nostoc sp. PA-18-2419 TaxID=2575443 RepID=UPI0011097311|nr:calcium-binding protein [Nostoc sp. PA-18-2419]
MSEAGQAGIDDSDYGNDNDANFDVDGNVMTYYYNGTLGSDYFDYLSEYNYSGDYYYYVYDALNAIGNNGNDTIYGGYYYDDTISGNEGNDYLYAGYSSGNNFLNGGYGSDTIYGGSGNDTIGQEEDGYEDSSWSNYIYAGAGNDKINSVGDDFIDAGAGNDSIQDYYGTDTILGGDGDDGIITFGGINDSIDGGAGDDYINFDRGGGTVIGGDGNDEIYSGFLDNTYNTTILGGNGDDTITGGYGDDTLNGGVGNDSLNGSGGNDTLNGGSGNDTLLSSINYSPLDVPGITDNDFLYGGTGDDVYYVETVKDVVTEYTSAGTDLVNSPFTYTLSANVENLILTGSAAINGYGNSLSNTIKGNTANNIIYGYDGNDSLNGGLEGNDYLDGGAGNDTLNGANGNDTLVGGTGNNAYYGGAGNDIYYVNSVNDVVNEYSSPGTDLVNSSITYTLSANVENLTLTGSAAINGYGNSLNNTITGNAGNNSLTGSTGNDTINGGAGNDIINGGAGKDVLTGGTGTDKFTYTALSDSLLASYDVITGYTSGEQIDRVGGSAVTLTTSVGKIASLTAANISTLLKSSVFTANSSKAFTVNGISGTFLAFNDATAGYNSANDSIIFLQSYTLGSVSIV